MNGEAQIFSKRVLFSFGLIFGSLAALVKVTTFLGLGYAAGIVIMINAGQTLCDSKSKPRINYDLLKSLRRPAMNLLLIGIPLLFVIIWTNHADTLKVKSVLAGDRITSVALHHWNFGSLEQRVSLVSLKVIYHRMLSDIWGNRATLIVLIGLSIFARGFRLRILTALILFAATFLTFINLNLIHNYYQYANGVFLIGASGLLMAALLRRGSIFKVLGYTFLESVFL